MTQNSDYDHCSISELIEKLADPTTARKEAKKMLVPFRKLFEQLPQQDMQDAIAKLKGKPGELQAKKIYWKTFGKDQQTHQPTGGF